MAPPPVWTAAIEAKAAMRRAWDLVGKFTEVMERSEEQWEKAHQFHRPVSELPASKEEIKSAIKMGCERVTGRTAECLIAKRDKPSRPLAAVLSFPSRSKQFRV